MARRQVYLSVKHFYCMVEVVCLTVPLGILLYFLYDVFLQIYTGKKGKRAERNQGMRVVLDLSEDYQGSVTCDNFFTT